GRRGRARRGGVVGTTHARSTRGRRAVTPCSTDHHGGGKGGSDDHSGLLEHLSRIRTWLRPVSRRAFCGGLPLPGTRSRATTATATGGRGSNGPTHRSRSPAGPPATTSLAAPKTSRCSPEPG